MSLSNVQAFVDVQFRKPGIKGELMKKSIALLLVACLITSVADSGEKRKVNANIASVYAAEGNIHEGMVKFKELIEKKTDGRFKVTVHPAGALGGERDMLEGLVTGTIEMGATGGMDVTLYAPEYVITEELFVFKNQKQVDNFWSGQLGQTLLKKLEDEKGLITVGNIPRGARWMTSNKPIHKVEDMKGLKIRLPDNLNRTTYFKTLGAIPSIVAFPELYMALKTGVVDAQENPPETIYNYRYYETQKYLIPSRHVFTQNRYLVSKRWLNRLDAEDQQLVLDTWKEAAQFAYDMTPDPDAYYVDKLVNEKGMTLIEDFDRPAFEKVAQELYPEFSKTWVPGLLEKVLALPTE